MPEYGEEVWRSPSLRKYYGLSLLLNPDKARAHLLALRGHPYYMSYPRISELSGVSTSNLSQLGRGRRNKAHGYGAVKEIHRDVEAAILGVKPEIDPPLRGGARVPPHGVQRRLQALMSIGFPMNFLSEAIGWTGGPSPLRKLMLREEYVLHSTYLRVVELYAKYQEAKPEDFGDIHPSGSKRARTAARKNGYAPVSCWDDDTIDDPDAFPEWTGACGSMAGYQIHQREDIPICAACKEARREARRNNADRGPYSEWKLDGALLAEKLNEKGMTKADLERLLGVSKGTASRWAAGDYGPAPGSARALALGDVFGIDWEEFYTKE